MARLVGFLMGEREKGGGGEWRVAPSPLATPPTFPKTLLLLTHDPSDSLTAAAAALSASYWANASVSTAPNAFLVAAASFSSWSAFCRISCKPVEEEGEGR